jgi:hypothetical protein
LKHSKRAGGRVHRGCGCEKQGIHKVILDLRTCGRGPISEVGSCTTFRTSGNLATTADGTPAQTLAARQQSGLEGSVSILIDGTTSGRRSAGVGDGSERIAATWWASGRSDSLQQKLI